MGNDHQIQRINDKLDSVTGMLTEMRINLSKNTVDLEHHIKRCDLLEARVEQVDSEAKKGRYSFIKLCKDAAVVLGLVAVLAKLFNLL